MSVDLVIRGGRVVTHGFEQETDISVSDGKIVSFDGAGSAREEIDATDLHIFPGLIDSHVHFNEPGRADWEGIETGSQALASGGGTLFFDMPLNAHPPTCDAESFDLKHAAASRNSLTDFALWGGLVPGNADQLEGLAERGVIGFKAFMSNSGIDDFSSVNDPTLREGMKRAAELNLPVAVHAESEMMTSQLAAEKMAAGKISARDYLESRPIAAEVDAIRRATEIAGETGCKLHIVHVSSGGGVEAVVAARKSGADVTCETCPHYLVLTSEDVEKIGALAKCAPPLRDSRTVGKLWEHLLEGDVATVGSDHSPSPPSMKENQNFFKIWGGISGVQHTLPLLMTKLLSVPHPALSLIAKWTSFNVAQRFRLPPRKGRIEVGADADFALLNLRESFAVRAEELHYRHRQSPYVGRVLTGRPVQTILRGKTIFKDGRFPAGIRGELIKPV